MVPRGHGGGDGHGGFASYDYELCVLVLNEEKGLESISEFKIKFLRM